nr:PREDICTED: centrosomal protein of 152 kDa-like [Bemisia tabaci]
MIMSDNPGVSLFQGNEELEIETNTQRLEEQEALEDERRRQAEIGNAIASAFEDLEDEDDLKTSDSSFSSSPNQYDPPQYYEHLMNNNVKKNTQDNSEPRPYMNGGYHIKDLQGIIDNSHLYITQPPAEQYQKKHAFENGHISPETFQQPDHTNTHQNFYNQNYGDEAINSKQLEVLYDIRLKEIDRLENELKSVRHEFEAEKNKLLRKATLMEAEKEKAVIARNSAQELLVESKEKISNSQKEIESLRISLKSAEQSKKELAKELQKSILTVDDLQRRLKAMESFNKNDVKQTDDIVKSLKSKHEHELSELSRKYESVKQELETKRKDVSRLQRTIEEMDNKHTKMLLEKTETINKLSQSLEKSQSQCQQLMTSSMSTDSGYLQKILDQTNREKRELEQKVQNLSSECEMLRTDLVTYENSIKYGIVQFDLSKQDKNDSIALLGLGENSYIDTSNESNRGFKDGSKVGDDSPITRLRGELHRSMIANKAKRNKITQLETKLRAAEGQIENLKQEEAKYSTQNKNLLENIHKLTEHINAKEKEWQEKEDQSERILLYEKQLREKEAKIEQLKEEIKSVRLDLEMKSMEVETQKSKISNDQFMLREDAVARIKRDVSYEKEKIIKQLELQLDQLRTELDEVKELYTIACADKKLLQEEKLNYLKQVSDISAEREALSKKLDLINKEKQRLLQQVEDLMTAKINLSKRIESLDHGADSKLKERLQEMEKTHQKALQEVREQVKEQTISYFAGKMEQLEDSYRARHSQIVMAQKKLEVQLEQRLREIEELKKEVNESKKEKEMVEKVLKKRVDELSEQIEAEREKAAEFLSTWTREVSDMQAETSEFKQELEKLRPKYHNLKKAVHVYKTRAEYFEKKAKEDHDKLKKSSELIEQKYKAMINKKELEIEEKLHQLEEVYQEAVGTPPLTRTRISAGDNVVTNDG